MAMLLAALLLEAATAATGDSAAMEALLRQISQPVPAATVFVEQRSSGLLEEPLLLRGRLSRPDADTLVRQVEQPWLERTTIADGQVLIEREGKPPRRFALRRAPELEALLASFHGLLSGDGALLERHYRLQLRQDGERWDLSLQPRAQRLARRVDVVRLWGRGSALRCMAIIERDGDLSRMLLGDAVGEDLDLQPPFDAECGGTP